METTPTAYAHILLRPDGTPTVSGTRLKVKHVAALHRKRGMSAEDLQRAFPSHSLGEIYSALAYYYDHRDEIDRALEEDEREEEALRAEIEAYHGGSAVLKKLKALGRAP